MPVTDVDVAAIIGGLEWKLIVANAQIKDLQAENEALKAEADKGKKHEAEAPADSAS